MIKHYIKIAWRNLWENKFFSLINLSGLAIGLAACLLITLFVLDELSYDKHFDKHDRIYRLELERQTGEGISKELFFPNDLPFALENEIHEIDNFTRIWGNSGDEYFKIDNKFVKFSRLSVDKRFFEIFNIPIITGSIDESVSGMSPIVISENLANRYYKRENPLGKIIYEKPSPWPTEPLLIVGVMKDIPSNTHFKADVIQYFDQKTFSFDVWPEFGSFMNHQYILLSTNANLQDVYKKLPDFHKKYNLPEDIHLAFQPITDIHLYSDFAEELMPGSDIRYIYIFSAIAFFLLLIAGINFVNLTTARSLTRAKEAGIRKTIGATKGQLIKQFLGESILFVLLALMIAFPIIGIAIPWFNNLYNKSLAFVDLFGFGPLVCLLIVLIILVVSACLYPALYLSRQNPVWVLKGVLRSSSFNFGLRKTLVITQFVISVILITGTIIIYGQMYFISNKRLGFDKENVLMIRPNNMREKSEGFRQELLRNPEILNVGVSSWNPQNPSMSYTTFQDQANQERKVNIYFNYVDLNYISTLDMELSDGRFFDKNFPSDFQGVDYGGQGINFADENSDLQKNRSVLLNETAVEKLGLKKPYLGQLLSFQGLTGRLIGIVKDFHTGSLHQKIPPLAFYAWQNPNYGTVYIRLNSRDTRQAIEHIKNTWKEFFPGQPFEFNFLDEALGQLYVSEKRLVRLFGVFAILAIGIACLGLFALAAFTTEQRTKEIGIRKVLGASVTSVVALLSRDFIRLVLIAIVIATPVAWYAMNRWLQGFAYRIELQWWMFAGAGLVAVVIAIVTVSGQSMRAAMADPIGALRNE